MSITKVTIMNRLIAYLVAGVAFLFATCQETKDDLKSPASEKDIYKTIGEEIPFETGMEWINYYRDKNSPQGRTELLSAYSISEAQLQKMLASTQNLVGVAFHYGIDAFGLTHIISVPIDETLSLWSSIPGRIFVDSNTGGEISQSVAAAWAQNYKDRHPSGIWFHFFGVNIFNDMCALPYFDSVDIERGINVLDLTPELLLVVYNDSLLNLGRAKNEVRGTVYDASNACPPCAVR